MRLFSNNYTYKKSQLKIEMFSPNFSLILANKHITYIKYWELNNFLKVNQKKVIETVIETGYNLKILIPLKHLSRKYINM